MKPATPVWRQIKASLARARLILIGLALLIIAAMLLEAIPPLILKHIIDAFLAAGVVPGLWNWALIYLAALIAAQLVIFLQNLATTVMGQQILYDLRNRIVDQLQKLPIRYYDRNAVGETMSRCTIDVEAVNTLFTSGIVTMVADLFRLLGVFGAMLILDWRLAVISVAVLPVVLGITEFFRRRIRQAERLTRQAVGRINADFQESIAGIRVIHAFGQEKKYLAAFDRTLERFFTAANRASFFNSFFPSTMDILKAGLTIGLVLAGLFYFRTDAAFSIGVLVAFIQLVIRFFGPITALSDEYQTIQQALAGIERINDILNEPEEERPAWAACPAIRRGEVNICDLHFGYFPDRPILKGINLRIEPGQRVTIIGRTGAGKTTLMNLLSGIYPPGEGSIRIDGFDPRQVHPEQRRCLLGIVPQTVQVFEGTIYDNVALGDPLIQPEAVERALETVGLTKVVSRLAAGIHTRLGPGGVKLSYGQEQLLSLARALILEPAVLLLDEPTSGMDIETERRLFRTIRAESGRRTTITISHRLSGIVDAQRVIVLAGGKVVQDGTPAELTGKEGWFEVYQTLEKLEWGG
jgi:ABC-type multidrug transport system fused ATPase/permease subunit